MLPAVVFGFVVLFVDDPTKPWSGIAYVTGCLTVAGIGWAVGHWLLALGTWVGFAVALVISVHEAAPADAATCDPACWSTADGYVVLFFVLGVLLTFGYASRLIAKRVKAQRG